MFIGFTVFLFYNEHENGPLPRLTKITSFKLTDSRNQTFDTKELSGQVWVADLFFTTCASVCPVLSKNMASLYRSYNLDKKVRFVSISVNPDNDTPEVLAKYAQQYQADPDQWHFLTGSIETIQDISVNQLKIGNKEEPVFHSPYFVLIDAQGWIRGYYDGMTAEGTKKIFKDIARVLKEKH
ncbi:MAG: SCO family protein [Candidatus Omnitrophica bacterium]|nr:SCO family protein [Candidatus Omnitrophota bacterium]